MSKTIGKSSRKRYRCTECGHESLIDTNHWGECYPRCTKCAWKHPAQIGQVHECLEPLPEGYSKPEPWKFVTLGEICDVS